MRVALWFLAGAATLWGLAVFAIGVERFIEWQERRRWEREVFDPSWRAMVTALEDMIEGVSK